MADRLLLAAAGADSEATSSYGLAKLPTALTGLVLLSSLPSTKPPVGRLFWGTGEMTPWVRWLRPVFLQLVP